MKKVLIAGCGIAGLTCGTYLLNKGYSVEIYDKNDYAGGFLTVSEKDGMIIDTCLHWMTGTKEGTRLNKIWKTNGALDNAKIIDPVSFFDVTYEGKTLRFYRDIDLLSEELHKYSDNDDKEIDRLIDTIKTIGIMETPSDIPYELGKPLDLNADVKVLMKTVYYINKSLEELANRFNSEIIKFALLNFPVNRKFSAYYFVMTLSNYINGNASLPVGCSKGVRDRMVERFLSLGGKIHLNSNVSKIIIDNNVAKGLVVDGNEIYGDYIVSSLDVHYTFNKLLDNKYSSSPYDEMDKNPVKYPPYSYVVVSFKTKYDFKDSISMTHKVDEYEFFGKKYNDISFRQYGYDKTLTNGDYKVVEVLMTTYLDEYNYLKNLSKDEYLKLIDDMSKFFKEKLEGIYHEEFIPIDFLSPIKLEAANNSYKGNFMCYVLTKKVPSYVRSFLVEGLSNFVLANQWLVLPGGTPVAATNGKLASQLVLYLDGQDFHID